MKRETKITKERKRKFTRRKIRLDLCLRSKKPCLVRSHDLLKIDLRSPWLLEKIMSMFVSQDVMV